MRIGIDARFYGPKAKGLGRYNQKLLEELIRLDDQNDYVVFSRQENFDEWQAQGKNFKKILADFRWYSFAEQIFFPWVIYRQKVDLMHFTHFNLPIFYGRPYVITIHDLILQRYGTARGQWLGRLRYWIKSLAYKIIIRVALWRAKKIIAVSQFVKNDIIKSFGASADKIKVIYEGAPDKISNFQFPISNLEKYKIRKPYLLYVGNAYPHKNLERLVEAFKILNERKYPDLQLVLVGGEDYFYSQLKKKNCNDLGVCFGGGVIFTGFVPDDELDILYANAELYVFPSLCEGFGLPPLEAMAQGAPVAASKATCLPEILGEAAQYFDAQNPADIAIKIDEVLASDALRQKLIAAGFERIEKYSWRKMAEETQKIYLGKL